MHIVPACENTWRPFQRGEIAEVGKACGLQSSSTKASGLLGLHALIDLEGRETEPHEYRYPHLQCRFSSVMAGFPIFSQFSDLGSYVSISCFGPSESLSWDRTNSNRFVFSGVPQASLLLSSASTTFWGLRSSDSDLRASAHCGPVSVSCLRRLYHAGALDVEPPVESTTIVLVGSSRGP